MGTAPKVELLNGKTSSATEKTYTISSPGSWYGFNFNGEGNGLDAYFRIENRTGLVNSTRTLNLYYVKLQLTYELAYEFTTAVNPSDKGSVSILSTSSSAITAFNNYTYKDGTSI
jgi:hypothetical protein